ncbi:MAG: 4Fe-4S binding protein [Deltaproteobacteria bacterium]|nr:4Fe-4S binding protein [Deltaproteobacteria bacterium]
MKNRKHIVICEDAKTRITINRKWCKGCEICVEFCPQKTLLMEGDKAVVRDIASCNRCMLCELRCPDFAIEVSEGTGR